MAEFSRNPIRMMRDAFVSVRGNAAACVFTEPLYSIPNTMYAGYMTLYMLELGVTKSQVGMITSIGLATHIFFALISSYITDKMGRKNTTLIFDLIGWVVAQSIWALAQNMYFFIAAAIVNAFGRIVMNSWTCLMIEDSKPETRIHIYNSLQIAGIAAGFFAPLGGLMISKLTLVPAMRMMLVIGTVSVIIHFFLRHFLVKETATGRQKMEEMKGVSIWDVFKSYAPALKRIFSDRLILVALFLRALNMIQFTIRNTFLVVLVTEWQGFPAETMAVYHTIIAIVMLIVLIFVTPLLSQFTRNWPISLGILFHIAATVTLLLSPSTQNYPLLILSSVLIALGASIAGPRLDALMANIVANEERSMVNAVSMVFLLLLSTPFGYIGGVLSAIDPRLPFILTFVSFLVSLLLLRVATIFERRKALDAGT